LVYAPALGSLLYCSFFSVSAITILINVSRSKTTNIGVMSQGGEKAYLDKFCFALLQAVFQ